MQLPSGLLEISLLALAAFLIRFLFVVLSYRGLPLSSNFEQFGAEMGWTARSIATGRGFSSPFLPQTGPTALVCPLFPTLLAGIFKIFGVYTPAAAFVALSFTSALSSLTTAVIYLGMRPHFGRNTARLAAMLWSLYPYAVYYSAVYLWDCALTSLLFAVCFFLALNKLPFCRTRAWTGYGALFGVTALSNPSVLSLFPVLLGWAACRRVRTGGRVAVPLLASCCALVLVLAPWTVRNALALHQPIVTRDGFWGEFYAGNSGDTSHSNPGWTHPASNPAEMVQYQTRGELGYMEWKRVLSIQQVREHPAAFVAVSARRVLRFWTGYWSFARTYLADEALDVPNVPFCVLLTALTVFGCRRLWQNGRGTALLFVATLLVFPLPYYITHASVDYRQPIEPMIVAVIAFACAATVRTHRARKQAERENHSLLSENELAVAAD